MRRELGTILSKKISVVSVDDMAKNKVGVPAVSQYHQLNRIFPEKDGPVLNDYDFPMPGYLISVSGYMFLQDEEKIDVSYDESNSYAVEALSGSEPDFQKITLGDLKGNIFTILSHQAHIQWNLKMSPMDCRDAIKKGMKGYLPENTRTVDFFANLDKELAFHVLDRLLKTTADLLRCKIFVFYKEQNQYLYKIISHKTSPTESPLYIFREWDGKYSFSNSF